MEGTQGDTRWAAAPPNRQPLSLPGGFQKAHCHKESGPEGKTLNSPGFVSTSCVTTCHTASLLRASHHEMHGSQSREAAHLHGARTQQRWSVHKTSGKPLLRLGLYYLPSGRGGGRPEDLQASADTL